MASRYARSGEVIRVIGAVLTGDPETLEPIEHRAEMMEECHA